MINHDLIARSAVAWNDAAREILSGHVQNPRLIDGLIGLLEYTQGVVLISLLAAGAARLRKAPGERAGTAWFHVVAAAIAASLLYWIVRFPSPDVFTLMRAVPPVALTWTDVPSIA